MALTIDTATAMRTLGEAFEYEGAVLYGVFDHPQQLYLNAILSERPTLVIATGAAAVAEGGRLKRLADGTTFEVVSPPEAIDEGSLERLTLKQV